MNSNIELIELMIENGLLKSPRVIDAFKHVDRKYFIPDEFKKYTYIDKPLPIGDQQTISQPSTVAFMLELLSVKLGDTILDIGSGSGWTTALLCELVGDSGKVFGLERVDKLVEIGQKNLAHFNKNRECSIQKAGKELGIPSMTFDKILISASAKETPKDLFKQLKIGGIAVMPIQNSIFRFKKLSESKIETQEFPGFIFVPLI